MIYSRRVQCQQFDLEYLDLELKAIGISEHWRDLGMCFTLQFMGCPEWPQLQSRPAHLCGHLPKEDAVNSRQLNLLQTALCCVNIVSTRLYYFRALLSSSLFSGPGYRGVIQFSSLERATEKNGYNSGFRTLLEKSSAIFLRKRYSSSYHSVLKVGMAVPDTTGTFWMPVKFHVCYQNFT